jgi:hypothetical protein
MLSRDLSEPCETARLVRARIPALWPRRPGVPAPGTPAQQRDRDRRGATRTTTAAHWAAQPAKSPLPSRTIQAAVADPGPPGYRSCPAASAAVSCTINRMPGSCRCPPRSRRSRSTSSARPHRWLLRGQQARRSGTRALAPTGRWSPSVTRPLARFRADRRFRAAGIGAACPCGCTQIGLDLCGANPGSSWRLWSADPVIGQAGSSLFQRVFSGASASGGCAPGLGLLECRLAHAGAQRGQHGIVVRDTWHDCVQPAAAFGFQERACGGEQPDGALRVVLLSGDGREALEVVGGGCFVSGLGRQRQSLLQESCRSGQVALGWLMSARS